MRSSLVAGTFVALFALAACETGTADRATTTPDTVATATTPAAAVIDLPSQPDCFAYQGTGEYAEVDLVGYCITGTQLVEVVRACEGRGNTSDECLALARAPESDAGRWVYRLE